MKYTPLWIVLFFSLVVILGYSVVKKTAIEPIRIGVLQSLTGELSVSGAPLLDAVRLAVEEINSQGGLLGHQLELVVADNQSDDTHVAEQAEKLFTQEHVSVLFACGTSSCRKAVKPVVERFNQVMFFPMSYEGMENSPNIIYTGSVPNQQVVPGARWAMDKFGKRVFLVGCDHIFSHIANLILRDFITMNGGEILSEYYFSAKVDNTIPFIEEIAQKKPDVILNSVNGGNNALLFSILSQNGLAHLPIVSFGVSEVEMKIWGGHQLTQHYGVWSYFQSIPEEKNKLFVAAFKNRYGIERVTSDPIEAAYVGVMLWANAVRNENSWDPAQLKYSINRQSIAGPSAIAALDSINHHLWKMARVGHVLPDGQFAQVFSTKEIVRPFPWPFYRSLQEWHTLIDSMEFKGHP